MDLALFLCYYFPPLGGGGVQRSAKFAKYLPEHGWQAVVLSAEPNQRNIIEDGFDPSLLNDVKGSNRIVRCPSIEMSVLYYMLHKLRARRGLLKLERVIPFLSHLYKLGWYLPAVREAKKIISEVPIKVIYSSSTPYSTHLVARHLKGKYGLPWVADFRDPWTQFATYNPPTRLHRHIEERVEFAILRDADVIIANTPLNKINLLRKYVLSERKITVIPNGFDPADFARRRNDKNEDPRFVISCVGNFYEMQNLRSFIETYRAFSEKHQDTLLRLFGWQPRGVRRALDSMFRQGACEMIGKRVEHCEAVNIMRESAVLLANVPNEKAMHWVPGKLYEYLGASKPILFIGPRYGDAASVIRETRAGTTVDFEDQDAALNTLENYYKLWRDGFMNWRPDVTAISRFSRKIQTQQLAGIFAELSQGTR